MDDTNSLIQIRKDKIKDIREQMGIDPFPYRYDVTAHSQSIINDFDRFSESQEEVSVAGRIMAMRIMGKASFCTIQDREGRIQLYVAGNAVSEERYSLFKKLDLGDIIGGRGTVKKTKMGEITVFLTDLTLLTKSIRPLPVVKEKDGETFDLFADK
ncbi:MAG TPA: OB-fold nucleic acid binding domain-containing protein, partial [Spirochaetota bacterium]|nr:OB-fold nucleic acid binding domain-containing protein [Spirochaetota bacterium]